MNKTVSELDKAHLSALRSNLESFMARVGGAGAHVTDALWGAAVGLVGRHGVALVARELGIDPGRLKHRVGRGAQP